jgi:fructose/tagatose bisphosphate aldolase
MNFKLGFGPMSREIVDSICDYTVSNKQFLMIIASRNQVDATSGYVMNTKELTRLVSSYDRTNLWLCRDHCGPYFLDNEKNLSQEKAIEATKKTIAQDIESGFDLIHIDTSRCDDTYNTAEELIKFSLDLNPAIKFEFGTEENIGVAAGLLKYKKDVKFAKQFPNMRFVVAQTGSLVMEDNQVGELNVDVVKELVSCANENGIELKEHNADYLTKEEILLRHSLGIHALNIAPQLGVIQTKLIKKLSIEHGLDTEWNEFSQAVLLSNKWKKWIINGDDDKKIEIAGHYLFQNSLYNNLIEKLESKIQWKLLLQNNLFKIYDMYLNQ